MLFACGNGKSYSASFTQYGSTDTWGSGNCQTKSTACGFYTQGYNAAVSQNVFGVGPVRRSSQSKAHLENYANKPSTGRGRRSRLRHMLEAHDPERQLRPPGQQRGQQHRRHGHQPVPGVRKPAVLAVWPLGNEPVWREPQLRSLHRLQGELGAVRKQWRGLGRG